MIQKISLIIITVAIICMALWLSISFYSTRYGEYRIESAIEKSNYCKVDGDCALIEGVCPISCYSAVNISKVTEIQKLVDNHTQMCRYSCLQPTGVQCNNMQRCEVRYD